MPSMHFLQPQELDLYGDWLKRQDADSRSMYFGLQASDDYIDALISRMLSLPDRHHVLVAANTDKWAGTLHIVDIDGGHQAEFGLMVQTADRGQGLGSRLMDQGITWLRNRGFDSLHLHCLNHNTPMKKLCRKYGLNIRQDQGESDAEVAIPPASFFSIGKEITSAQNNFYSMMLKGTWLTFRELYG